MKRIGIIGAMEEEVALLKEQMQIEKRVEKASMEFCAGKLNGQEAVVVSGDQFISDKATKDRIISNFGGFCTEMEGAAIAQTAYLNKVPFVIVRAISDKADDSASVDYPTFEAQAIEHSVKLIENFVSRLPEDAY